MIVFRALAALMVGGLWLTGSIAWGRGVIRWLFARLSFTPYLAGSEPWATQQFVGRLVREVSRKRRQGELSFRFLLGWVAALSYQAAFGPSRRARFRARSGREALAFAILSPSGACNLRCTHCYAAEARPTGALAFSEVERLVAGLEGMGTNLVLLSGGEPLLWCEGERGLFDLAARHPTMLFVVYTNGTCIDAAVAQRFARAGNLLPLVSIEGFEADTDAVRGRGTFAAVENALSELRRAGVLFGLSITATSSNAATLGSPEFARRFIDEVGASFLWVLELAALGRAGAEGLLDGPTREAVQAALERESEQGRLIVSFLHTPSARSGCFGARRFDGFVYVDWQALVHRCVYQPAALVQARRSLHAPAEVDSLLIGCSRLGPCGLGAGKETKSWQAHASS